MSNSPFIVLHSEKPGQWLFFEKPLHVLSTSLISEVLPLLELVDAHVRQGRYAAGVVSYEAAPAFDKSLDVNQPNDFPLVWFGIYDDPRSDHLPKPDLLSVNNLSWIPSITENEYSESINQIKDYIRDGHTYQVNFTFRMKSGFSLNPWNYFRMMNQNHRMPFAAFLDIGSHAICSFSPELFFTLHNDILTSQPMKGTAARGRFLAEDRRNMDSLHNSPKDRAENIMIVDMIRNDMGRIAKISSTQVSDLYKVEPFPTILQMTSTVSAQTQASMPAIFRALFPCASVTGAPKIRTMQIIKELEHSPRGIYCGSIGYYGPGRQARFSVAIRTISIDKKAASAEYSVGSGVIWDSVTGNEYQECLKKAEIITQSMPDFSLFESLLWTPMEGYFLLDYHVRRMIDSANYFGFLFDESSIAKYLDDISRTFPAYKALRVRLVLQSDGTFSHTSRDYVLGDHSKPIRLMLAKKPINSADPFLFHKTTNRIIYDDALKSCPGADDVILWNESGQVTETSIANIVVESDGKLLTPKLECGLLPGTFRAAQIQEEKITESIISKESLKSYAKIFRINSIRKWEECAIIDEGSGRA